MRVAQTELLRVLCRRPIRCVAPELSSRASGAAQRCQHHQRSHFENAGPGDSEEAVITRIGMVRIDRAGRSPKGWGSAGVHACRARARVLVELERLCSRSGARVAHPLSIAQDQDGDDSATPLLPEHPSAALALDADAGNGIAAVTSVWRRAPRGGASRQTERPLPVPDAHSVLCACYVFYD